MRTSKSSGNLNSGNRRPANGNQRPQQRQAPVRPQKPQQPQQQPRRQNPQGNQPVRKPVPSRSQPNRNQNQAPIKPEVKKPKQQAPVQNKTNQQRPAKRPANVTPQNNIKKPKGISGRLDDQTSTGADRHYTDEHLKSSRLAHNPEVSKKQKKKKVKKFTMSTLIGVLILALLAGGGVFWWFFIKNAKPTLENIRPRIAELYLDDSKSDVKQTTTASMVDDLLDELAQITIKESEETEKNSFVEELKTIKTFINDKDALSKMSDPSYDLDTPDYLSNITGIRTNASVYSVAGLRVTNLKIAEELGDEQNQYKNIRQSLIGVASGTDIDPADYVEDIEASIKHTPTKEKLTKTITDIQQKQALTSQIDQLEKDPAKNQNELAKLKDQRNALDKEIMSVLTPNGD